jgi:hypothetical protein
MYKANWWFRTGMSLILTAIMCIGILKASGQDANGWQPGTVIQVKAHDAASDDNSAKKQYDVTVQVGKKIYVASHTQQEGEPDLEYYVGMSRMVLIDGSKLTFNDLLGHPHTMQILSTKDAPEAQGN